MKKLLSKLALLAKKVLAALNKFFYPESGYCVDCIKRGGNCKPDCEKRKGGHDDSYR